MILRDGGEIVSDTEKVADAFNKLFVNTHLSISNIKTKQKMNSVFSLRNITYEEILSQINNSDISKLSQLGYFY